MGGRRKIILDDFYKGILFTGKTNDQPNSISTLPLNHITYLVFNDRVFNDRKRLIININIQESEQPSLYFKRGRYTWIIERGGSPTQERLRITINDSK